MPIFVHGDETTEQAVPNLQPAPGVQHPMCLSCRIRSVRHRATQAVGARDICLQRHGRCIGPGEKARLCDVGVLRPKIFRVFRYVLLPIEAVLEASLVLALVPPLFDHLCHCCVHHTRHPRRLVLGGPAELVHPRVHVRALLYLLVWREEDRERQRNDACVWGHANVVAALPHKNAVASVYDLLGPTRLCILQRRVLRVRRLVEGAHDHLPDDDVRSFHAILHQGVQEETRGRQEEIPVNRFLLICARDKKQENWLLFERYIYLKTRKLAVI